MNQLAAETGVSVGLISMIENGHTRGSPATAKKLADVLGVTVDDLWIYEDC